MTKPGYQLDRDDRGLTARERQVYDGMLAGETFAEIAAKNGVTKQRVSSLVKALIEKGFIVKTEAGEFAAVIKR